MSQQNFVSYDDATSIVTEVASKIAGKQDVLSFDNSPTQNSDNPVKSGGVYTALASKANTSDIGTAAAKNFTTSVTSGSNDLVTSGAVYTAIENLPEPMVFRGSLGTGGTITALPVDGTATKGDTYKVITAGTYASKAAKVGDTFVCLTKTSSANTWELIPSGDEPSGTVTSVTLKATSPIAIDSSSAITTSGTRTLSHANSGATAGSYGDSGNQTPGYGSTFKVPYVTVNATGHVTAISEHTVKIPASDNTNTTYTFANGTNGFTVTPSGGSAQTVKVTPSFTVTTGDANGQVKVNGTNADVKGLGSAAYTASTDYAPASHTHSYLPLSGGTMTGCITTTPNDVNINFRNHSSYYCTASYQTAGNEALVFATKNAVTSFMFVNGEDSVTNHSDSRWKSITPGLQIKNNCVSINKLIADGTTPTYNLEVNGTQYISGALTTGSTISATGAISSSGAITAGGLLTAVTGLYTGGRVYNAGDDEGIIIKPTGNGYAGLILGSHNARRSVFYLNSNNVFWRYNNGSASYDINHPGKAGTIALTSDVTNATDPIFYGACSTTSTTAAKVATCSKFSGLATGVTVKIKFTNENYVDNPTLNVNSTGAKAIYKHGYAITRNTNPGWKANDIVSFTYDGTCWNMNDAMDTCLLHVQSMDNNTDTSNLGCSVSGTVGILQGTLRVKTACQDLFTIGVSYRTTDIIGSASGILVNTNTSKSIYTINGIGNEFTCSSTVPVGTYTVICNFCVKYAYSDLLP